mmetsp:Transcript_81003/g.169120  ORF Transcript_81003/g.169120 Transcript_81003/m.169120 type:complete len:230 (+) Transcript_81003:1224-1913(+)
MSLQNRVHQVRDALRLGQGGVPLLRGPLKLHRGLEEVKAFWGHGGVVLDCLHEEPRRIPGVVARPVRRVQQIWAEAMPDDRCIDQERVPGFLESVGEQQAPAKADEGVSAPVPHKAAGKMGKTGSQGGHLEPALFLCPIPMQRSAGSGGPKLGGSHGEVLQQAAAGAPSRQELSRSLEQLVASGAAKLRDHSVELEGNEIARHLRQYLEHTLQPSFSLAQTREIAQSRG